MSALLEALSPKVMLGIGILIAAMAVGYLVVASEQNKKDEHETISAADYFDKMTDEKVDENFKEYLEEEKKIEETPDILSGQTERYEWLQNAKEIDMYIPLDETAKSRDISCKITASALTVAVKGSVVVSGDFTAAVVPAECNWQIGMPLICTPALSCHVSSCMIRQMARGLLARYGYLSSRQFPAPRAAIGDGSCGETRISILS